MIHIYVYIYIYTIIHIYVYGTPPQRSTKFNASTDIVGYFRLQDCPEVCWQNLGSRLKPIEPIEISIGTTIQDPRFQDCSGKPIKPIEISIGARIQDPRSKIAQGSSLGILDLGSWSRLKFQSVQSVSTGIQDSANRPLDNLGSWILDPIPD